MIDKSVSTEVHDVLILCLVCLDGGAYITLEAGDVFVGLTLARMQARYAKLDVFSINYRLAPGSKYPCQLFEAFSAFKHVREMGYENVLIGGDSAGANLALLLWKYVQEIEKDAKSIKGLILHSPWLEMEGFKRKEYKENLHTCALTPTYTQIGFQSLQSNGLPKSNDPWISPIMWDSDLLSLLPPVIVTNGGFEALLEEANIFVKNIRRAGKDVDHFIMVSI